MRPPPFETLNGKRVFFVMAAEAEYRPHLRARFRPLHIIDEKLARAVNRLETALGQGLLR